MLATDRGNKLTDGKMLDSWAMLGARFTEGHLFYDALKLKHAHHHNSESAAINLAEETLEHKSITKIRFSHPSFNC